MFCLMERTSILLFNDFDVYRILVEKDKDSHNNEIKDMETHNEKWNG